LPGPGGNTTDVSLFATELNGKRQEILIEAVPGLRRMAILADAKATRSPELQALQDAARARDVEVSIFRVVSAEEITAALDKAKASGTAGINVLASPFLYGSRQLILDRVAALRLPAIYEWAEVAEEGGFLAYGPRIFQVFRELVARFHPPKARQPWSIPSPQDVHRYGRTPQRPATTVEMCQRRPSH
jgi:putative ABC transport system substrate-binding protein